MRRRLRVGDHVKVPWGIDETVEGTIVEVWGDPPAQIRVELTTGEDEPVVLLLSASVVEAA
jgi:hypothetical protein